MLPHFYSRYIVIFINIKAIINYLPSSIKFSFSEFHLLKALQVLLELVSKLNGLPDNS